VARIMRPSHAIVALFVVLCVCPVAAEDGEVKWEDSHTTTRLWQAISSGDQDGLQAILDEDAGNAMVRAGDGRGPLFWAYEYKNTDAISLLEEKGADNTAKDADGKMPTEVDKTGEMTEFMKQKLAEEAIVAAQLAEQQAAAAAAAAAAEDEEDDYEDDDEDDDEEDDEEETGDKEL